VFEVSTSVLVGVGRHVDRLLPGAYVLDEHGLDLGDRGDLVQD
jgi:hypothetical protein